MPPPPPPPPLADNKPARRVKALKGTMSKGSTASAALVAEGGEPNARQSARLSSLIEEEVLKAAGEGEEEEGGRLDPVSIQEFVAEYHFNTERFERVVFELEEAERQNEVPHTGVIKELYRIKESAYHTTGPWFE